MNNIDDCENNKLNSGFNWDEDTEDSDLESSQKPIPDILSMIKSIDRIIFVDDVRKYSHDDIVKMCKEIDRREKENNKFNDTDDSGD